MKLQTLIELVKWGNSWCAWRARRGEGAPRRPRRRVRGQATERTTSSARFATLVPPAFARAWTAQRAIPGCLAIALATGIARADMVFTENLNIPIGNPVGVAPVGTVSGVSGNITGLTVDLNVSGGYNGNLYAYLEAPNGSTAVLLNRPGVTGGNPFGYGGSGFNVTFSEAASASLQTTPETFGAVVTGTYLPVGSFSAFNGLSGDGSWTLFIADDADGGSQPVLNSWGLDISTSSVPEPGQVAGMMLLGLAGVGVVAVRWKKMKTVE